MKAQGSPDPFGDHKFELFLSNTKTLLPNKAQLAKRSLDNPGLQESLKLLFDAKFITENPYKNLEGLPDFKDSYQLNKVIKSFSSKEIKREHILLLTHLLLFSYRTCRAFVKIKNLEKKETSIVSEKRSANKSEMSSVFIGRVAIGNLLQELYSDNEFLKSLYMNYLYNNYKNKSSEQKIEQILVKLSKQCSEFFIGKKSHLFNYRDMTELRMLGFDREDLCWLYAECLEYCHRKHELDEFSGIVTDGLAGAKTGTSERDETEVGIMLAKALTGTRHTEKLSRYLNTLRDKVENPNHLIKTAALYCYLYIINHLKLKKKDAAKVASHLINSQISLVYPNIKLVTYHSSDMRRFTRAPHEHEWERIVKTYIDDGELYIIFNGFHVYRIFLKKL